MDYFQVYDCKVEATALRHGNKCVYEHSAGSDRPGLGENIYKTSTKQFEKNRAAKQVGELTYSEVYDLN